ncbi:NusB antitermination factor [Sinobacterium caligoides]|uniref:Transcription antitermination protein NusB n=1 Tax=Sinobacterium caligoides TaxID=933926 RepID=A0A3N2DPA5_9GAMM|nr:transcription antitermination factor NusB [Sinobacterium caligoides]ROS01627.1 NusB antitermination factor [Sinobacterium caligoides]
MSKQTNGTPKPPLSQTRHKARHYAMQALYQWQMAGSAVNAIEAQFRAEYDMSKVDVHYFHDLLHGVPANLTEIEALFEPLLDRKLADIDQVEMALLRLGTYELLKRIDVPYKVVINESVGLAKKFGAADSHKYVNGILDKLAQQLRPDECAAS